jgi:hypothetical protein
VIIVFDIFLDNHELVARAKSTPEVNACLQEVYSFVAGKLEPLRSEIDKEEQDEEGEPKGTIIFLEPPVAPSTILGFHGYPAGLAVLMLACFTEDDFTFIIQKINFLQSRVKP